MTLTERQKISFYKNRKKVGEVILRTAKKRKHIVFGSRSLNRQFPKFLDKQTSDYDLLTEKPAKGAASRIEKNLDKKFGGNFFEVKEAAHPGTFKVVSRVTKDGVADVTQRKERVRTKKIKGIKYSALEHEEGNVKKSLADKESAFRHDKDRERLQRIKIFRGLKGKRKTVKRRKPKNLGTRARRFKPFTPNFNMPKIRPLKL